MFRDATKEDWGEFLDLWKEYLEELKMYGGEYEPDLETLRDVRNLFDAYVTGALRGLVVLYDPPGEGIQGAGFIGETRGAPSIRDSRFGYMAHGWGIHIRPAHREKRVGYHLQVNIGRKLRELGFDTVSMTVLRGNEPAMKSALGIGMEPHAVVLRGPLETWTHG